MHWGWVVIALLLAAGAKIARDIYGRLGVLSDNTTADATEAWKQSPRPEPQSPMMTKEEEFTKNYGVCLVVPAREFELVNELRRRVSTQNPIDGWLARQLKDTAQGLWYGAVEPKDPNYTAIERVVKTTEPSFNSSLDMVICLLYLKSKNLDLEVGNIGRIYDGILALEDSVERMEISQQVRADALRDISLISI